MQKQRKTTTCFLAMILYFPALVLGIIHIVSHYTRKTAKLWLFRQLFYLYALCIINNVKRGNPKTQKGAEEGEGLKIKRLINRLTEWLKAYGMKAEDILDCIEYITK